MKEDKQQEEIKFLKDKVASRLFSSEACRDYVKAIICAALNIDKKDIKDLELIDTHVESNVNVKRDVTDVMFRSEQGLINIEINYNAGKRVQAKNFFYLCHLFIREQKINEEHKGNRFYQINLNNFDVFGKGEFMYWSTIRDVKYNLERYEYFKIVDINVAKLKEIPYNEIEKEKTNSLKRMLYFIVDENNEKLDNLYRGDEMMEKVRTELNNMMEDFDSLLYYDPEELYNMCCYDDGFEEGEKKTKTAIAKKMKKEQIDIDIIAKCTGLSKEEINKL